MKDEGSSEGKRTQRDVPAGDECVQAITFVFMLDSIGLLLFEICSYFWFSSLSETDFE